MSWRPLLLVAVLAVPAAMRAQEVEVYSEFRRVGADGQIVEADRGGKPREILSPPVPRNGYATFNIAIKGPAGKPFHVYVGENPEGIVKTTLYRVAAGAAVPDAIEKIDSPYSGFLPDGGVPLVLDVFAPATLPVRRVRIEIQLSVDNHWIIYPMELRIQPASIPAQLITTGALLDPKSSVVENALAAWQPVLCTKPQRATTAAGTIRELVRRNALQDIGLAKKLETRHTAEKVRNGVTQALGASNIAAWCGQHTFENPENYLKLRDFLYKLATEGQ
ncbi:MAG: hypothetical protein IT168_26820 [Bryobacterales bacterium]|nr:hypothetical protein [Bryobacterales bacterium]